MSKHIKKKLPLSYVEISKKSLIHNVKQFRSLLKKGTNIAVVIKGNAYGHGQNITAKILEPYVDCFQIDSIEELRSLRRVSQKKALIFGYIQKADLGEAVKLGCISTVFSTTQLKELNRIAESCKIKQEIHIPVDAYLGREGFLLSELPKIFSMIKKCRFIELSGIYAHFANIEDTDDFSHAEKQINEYKKALQLAIAFGFTNLQTHISATSGILVYEKYFTESSLVRLGLGVYGMWPSENLKKINENKIKLKPVLSWKTKITQIKTLPKGSTVGYGLTYKAKRKIKIAIIPQGYADGFDRGLSNKGEILIGGTRCKVIGRVSMNMFVVDISHLRRVKVEDQVVILGSQGRNKISAEEIAKLIDTINYEITTKISALLPRIVN